MDIVRTWPRLNPSRGDRLLQPFTRNSFYPVNRRFVIFKAKSHSDLNLRLALLALKCPGILRHPGRKNNRDEPWLVPVTKSIIRCVALTGKRRESSPPLGQPGYFVASTIF